MYPANHKDAHMKSFGLRSFLMGIVALFSLAFVCAFPASAAALRFVEPTLYEVRDTGPVAPVYLLSHQTDGAIFRDLHRRC
jgi:hypothetical protein